MKPVFTTLDTAEVLRYLGYNRQTQSPLDPAMQQMITECIADTCSIITPAYRYLRLPITRTDQGEILLGESLRLPGEKIHIHLRGCHAAFVLCVTVGLAMDRKIREQMLLAPERGVIYNSCGTTAVEEVADFAQAEIKSITSAENELITPRFSPGYGDLPLSIQKDLLTLLSAHKTLGVSLNDSDLMIPEKSVSALIGVFHPGAREVPKKPPTCGTTDCNQVDTCSFAKPPASQDPSSESVS